MSVFVSSNSVQRLQSYRVLKLPIKGPFGELQLAQGPDWAKYGPREYILGICNGLKMHKSAFLAFSYEVYYIIITKQKYQVNNFGITQK